MDIDRIKEASKGRWYGIFEHFGIDVGNGKHRPCPACGGKDRFRCDNKGGMGEYICGACGAGDGISLVQKVTGLQFIELMKIIGEIVGEVDPDPKSTRKEKDPRIALNKTWSESQKLSGLDPVFKYLRSRKIILAPDNLRFCPSCYESNTKQKYPAMMARVQNNKGNPVSIHRTYLGENGKADIENPKKLMPGTEPLSGAAIRLFTPDGKIFEKDVLGVAEGIETACAAAQLFRIATWATITTSIMVGFKPPKEYRKIKIFGDNDDNFAGQKAAYILANKLYLDDLVVDVEIPEERGDWNDFLMEQQQAGVE